MHRYLPSSLAVLLLAASPCGAVTTILNPAADTTLNESTPGNNMGGHVNIHSGTNNTITDRRGLLRFDISGIPAGATITSASLQLTVPSGSTDVGSIFGLHLARTAWGEGNKAGNNGSPAGPGEATWNDTGSGPWTAGGGSAGADYIAAASASTAVSGLGDYTFTSPGLAADVQAWLDGSASNEGWFLISASEGTGGTARRFGSRDSTTPPVLTIEYVPEPSAAMLAAFSSAGLLLRRRRNR